MAAMRPFHVLRMVHEQFIEGKGVVVWAAYIKPEVLAGDLIELQVM